MFVSQCFTWTQSCPPPPGCGSNPEYFCGEITDFNWAMIPNGPGQYNIHVKGKGSSTVATTFYLMSGGTVIATLSGASGSFPNISPACYRIVVCVQTGTTNLYCCKDLPCPPGEAQCCELLYQFYTDVSAPLWDFGDHTTSTDPNPAHEYTNLNTYYGEGTPQATVTLSWGTATLQSQILFPEGIWIGRDREDSGNASALTNSVNPSLPVLPNINYQSRRISIKGSLTMDAPFQFTDCDFCMNPASRIVSVAKGLAFLSGTRLHEALCKNQAWYGIEVQRGTVIGNGASFRGAYNAIRTPAGSTYTPTYQFTDCQFYRNYLGMNIASPVTFGAFSGNTFGLDAGVEPWPGLGANACSWVAFIGKPALLRPFAGIYAETPANSANVVTVNLPDLALGPNVFINLSNGIYLNDANATVRQCRFQNMIPGAYFQGNKGDDGFGVALFTNHTRNLQQWGLGKTNALLTFDNCLHAVYADLNPQLSSGNVLLMSGNNTIIRCNTIGSHDIGLFYDAAAVTGWELPGDLSAGIVWTGTYSTWAAYNGNMAWSNSRYFYRNGEINALQVFPPGWFTNVTEGITCSSGCPQNQSSGKTVTELDNQIAGGTLDPGGLPGYLLERNLYNDLLYYLDLLAGNAHLQDFYTSYTSANGGKLAAAEKALAGGFHLSAQQQTQWDAAQSDLLAVFDTWAMLDSLVQAGADPDGQTARREALRQQAAAAEMALRATYDANLSARTASVVSIQQTLDSVSPQAQWESNEKTLDDIFLHTAFVDAAPDAAQTDQIEQIARQCLADGGPAVTRARAWYMALMGTRIEVECGAAIERMGVKQASDSENLLIYPDPAQNRIAIQFPDPASPGRRLEIIDSTGKLCKVIEVSQEALMTECSIADLPNGYYFCRLSEGEKMIATAKFFVLH